MKALAKGDRTYMHQCHLGHLDHFEIRGKTYGIICGLGYIASNISKKALGLGMKVIVSDMPSTPLGMRDTGVEVQPHVTSLICIERKPQRLFFGGLGKRGRLPARPLSEVAESPRSAGN
eukprot:s2314_g8.t1